MVVTARKWPKTVAPATMTRIMQEIRVVSFSERTKFLPGEVPADQGDDDRTEGPDAGGLGRREEADEEPPHDQDEKDKGFDHAGERGDPLPEGCLGRGDAETGLEAGPDDDGEMKSTVRRIPGRTPAMKSLPTDCSVMIP